MKFRCPRRSKLNSPLCTFRAAAHIVLKWMCLCVGMGGWLVGRPITCCSIITKFSSRTFPNLNNIWLTPSPFIRLRFHFAHFILVLLLAKVTTFRRGSFIRNTYTFYLLLLHLLLLAMYYILFLPKTKVFWTSLTLLISFRTSIHPSTTHYPVLCSAPLYAPPPPLGFFSVSSLLFVLRLVA